MRNLSKYGILYLLLIALVLYVSTGIYSFTLNRDNSSIYSSHSEGEEQHSVRLVFSNQSQGSSYWETKGYVPIDR